MNYLTSINYILYSVASFAEWEAYHGRRIVGGTHRSRTAHGRARHTEALRLVRRLRPDGRVGILRVAGLPARPILRGDGGNRGGRRRTAARRGLPRPDRTGADPLGDDRR